MSFYYRFLFLYSLLVLPIFSVQAIQSHDFFLKFADVFPSYFRLWYAVNCRIDEIARGEQSIELMQSKCRDDLMNHGRIYLNVLNKQKKFEELLETYDVAPADYSFIYDHMKIIEKSQMMILIHYSGESLGLIDNISKAGKKVTLETLRQVLTDYKLDDVSDINTNKLNAKKRIEIYLYDCGCGDDIQKDIDFCKTKEGAKFEKVFHDFLNVMDQTFSRLARE